MRLMVVLLLSNISITYHRHQFVGSFSRHSCSIFQPIAHLRLRGGEGSEIEEICRGDDSICVCQESATDKDSESSLNVTNPIGCEQANNTVDDVDGQLTISASNRFEPILELEHENDLDNPSLDPAVQYFLTRCPSGKADAGKYIGSCRFHLCSLVDSAWDGQVGIKELRSVFEAIEAAGLYMEPGMFNLVMAMVAGAAHNGDAGVEDGEAVMRWVERTNASRGGMDWGLDIPPRRAGIDSAQFLELRRNFSDESPRMRDFHCWTDLWGNTLRSVFESFLGVAAGAAKHGQCGVDVGYKILERMRAAEVPPDVDTYTQMLQVVGGAARHGRASMADAESIFRRMVAEGYEPYSITYGCWIQVVAACAGRDGRTTWRDAEALLEIELRKGIRPDMGNFYHMMEAVANQAELGMPTPTAPGEYVYDPVADARAALLLLGRVEPIMHPDHQMLHWYSRAVLAAARHGAACVADAEWAFKRLDETFSTMLSYDNGTDSDMWRPEHWSSDYVPRFGLHGETCNALIEAVVVLMEQGRACLGDALKILSRMEIEHVVPQFSHEYEDCSFQLQALAAPDAADGISPDNVTKALFHRAVALERAAATEVGVVDCTVASAAPGAAAAERHSALRQQKQEAEIVYALDKASGWLLLTNQSGAGMPNISCFQEFLRESRDNIREPGLTFMGFPVKYHNTDFPGEDYFDPYDGLKAID